MTKGCGRRMCENINCASNPKMIKLDKKQTFIRAVKLARKGPKKTLCQPIQRMPPACELKKMIDKAKTTGEWKDINRLVYSIFSDRKAISESFLERAEDGYPYEPTEANCYIDFKEMDETYELIASSSASVTNCLGNAIDALSSSTQQILNSSRAKGISFPLKEIRAYIILLDNRLFWQNQDYQEFFKCLLKAIGGFTSDSFDLLSRWFAEFTQERLELMIGFIQQFITLRWMNSSDSAKYEAVQYATKVLGILYTANEIQTKSGEFKEGEIILAYKDFYNEAINEDLYNSDMRYDYRRWQKSTGFAFANHAYILDAGCKAKLLKYHSRVQMGNTVRANYSHRGEWYLILEVDRNNLIRDTLAHLQTKNGSDFKKPLKIKFKNEDGVDEGGVKKEFFQLIIEELFDPQYGMFQYMEETRTFWFRHHSTASRGDFELIGIILGLAIYNSVLLNVRFPDVVYKKLMKQSVDLKDFTIVFPEMGKALNQLLEFVGDVESTYCRNFTVSHTVFGETKVGELKKGGADIPLTESNRKEYVDLYVKYELEKSIAKDFNAFYEGFDLVCGGAALKLFRWEEIQLLICGCPALDFEALEESCRYADGYTADSKVIEYFWDVVRELPLEDKKKFLFFCSGSDRAPIKGLGKLNFVISRQGPDSDRLPSAHTCFNHLLLPEYTTKEKLQKLLLLAIENSKGFGLL